MTKTQQVGVAWVVSATCCTLGCGGQATAEGGTGGTAPLSATGGTPPVSGTSGAGPQDAGADVFAPPPDGLFVVDIDPLVLNACPVTTVSIEPVSAATTCTYLVPVSDGMVFDPNLVNVIYTAADQTQYGVTVNNSATCDFGWHYIDDAKTEIEICGSTCDTIKHDSGAQITLWFGCSGVPLIK
jgi:hypothetical protein